MTFHSAWDEGEDEENDMCPQHEEATDYRCVWGRRNMCVWFCLIGKVYNPSPQGDGFLKEMGSVVLMVDCDAKSTSKVLLDLHTIRAMAPHIHPNCEPSLLGQSQSDVKNA